ncbi:unnamed protein product [Thelazia callipaeda]|uniref:Uncharacterized protein n=1 Tax=Thelazia callipaeda TaxID=103827 RepID=A0A0N5CL03_THECL|nr:unnamed protein product [Thelazia callipaeda]
MSVTTYSINSEVKSRPTDGINAAISQEEFFRLQGQLLDLRNRNYELLEENKRQQKYINCLASKGADSSLFVAKLVGRKREKENSNEKLETEVRLLRNKLSAQEEEFRLQQSTLLSELNKVAIFVSFSILYVI